MEKHIYIDQKDLEIQIGLNGRENYGELDELMLSIVENGVQQPLKGWEQDGKYYPADGHRRQKAILIAREKGLPIRPIPFLVKEYTNEDKLLAQIILNSGKPLEMLEEALILRRLMDEESYDRNMLIKKTGKNKNVIHNLLSLAFADKEIHDLVRYEKISPSNAIKIIQAYKGDTESQIAAISEGLVEAADEGKERATVKHVQKLKNSSPIQRVKSVISKIQTECLTETKLNPGAAKAVEVFGKVLNGGMTVSKAISELKSI